MAIIKNLPSILNLLNFNAPQYGALKIERPYREEIWVVESNKSLGLIRVRYQHANVYDN